MSQGYQDLHDLDLRRFYKIYTTVHEMNADRGFIPETPFLSKKEFTSRYIGLLAELEDTTTELDLFGFVDQLSLIFSKGTKRLFVYFYPLESKLCQSDMNYIHSIMKENNTQYLMVVASTKSTPKVSSAMGILGNHAQFFNEDELVYNVTKHQLVPRHELLTGKERDEVVNNYLLNDTGEVCLSRAPGLYTSDPVVKYYNWDVDSLIKIYRPRKDGYYDVTYRVVTHPMSEKDC